VGIPSLNEADSISYVVKQADKGLTKYFPDFKCEIINVDNNSQDNTKEAFLKTKTKIKKVYISTPSGVIGKGNNFYNSFKYFKKTNAKYLVVVDADLKSITPEWIQKLATPLLKGTDFVFPNYIRHRCDGPITNTIVFPLIYSLFNKHIRQPIGGEFATSSKVIDYYLNQEWTETTRQYGIDIFMTIHALIGGFTTTQVLLGQKIHKSSAPKIGRMFTEVVDTLFNMIDSNKNILEKGQNNKKPMAEFLQEEEPEEVIININKMKNTAIQQYNENKGLLKEILKSNTFERVEYSFNNGMVFDSDLWADVVFELLNIYRNHEDKRKIIEAFKPLYLAKNHYFTKQTSKLSSYEAEKRILKRAEIFHEKKSNFFKNTLKQQSMA